ncbi:MAG: alpha/beta hydrolase [Verrucomicrobia bacterium]|nr:alpha/beta hydrolase [Verrucomicrobiota bacterium]
MLRIPLPASKLMCAVDTDIVSEAVILLHGLARTSRSFARMERSLSTSGYWVQNLDYPSRRFEILELASMLHSRIVSDEKLMSCERIHFVTHSLGGIVLRALVREHGLSKLGRVVMLGPPNCGSEVVDCIGKWGIFGCINGPAGRQLGTGEDSVPNCLGGVAFELGVIAGDRSINWINSLMIPGPDDGKVAVERTKVEGMKEHIVLPTTHPTMLYNRKVIELTIHFLRHGTFQQFGSLQATTTGVPVFE